MEQFTAQELHEALTAIRSVIHKCEKAQQKFPAGNTHHTLLRNRLKAMYISAALIAERLSGIEQAPAPQVTADGSRNSNVLISHLEQLHTTALGAERIKKNLRLSTDDVTGWCREQINAPSAKILRKGKNWYIIAEGCQITVNANSYTIITAHKHL